MTDDNEDNVDNGDFDVRRGEILGVSFMVKSSLFSRP